MTRVHTQSYRIAVFGASSCPDHTYETARTVGREIARRKAVLLCGGLGGVMEASARGAYENGGLTIGILPGYDDGIVNPYITIPIVTNMGHSRNVILAHTCHGAIAVSGEYGTLSEIAITMKLGKPVVSIHSWNIDPSVTQATDPHEAVSTLFQLLENKP